MTCPSCEYNKERAKLWRNEAYRLGGTPLPWSPDEKLLQQALAALEDARFNLADWGAECDKTIAALRERLKYNELPID